MIALPGAISKSTRTIKNSYSPTRSISGWATILSGTNRATRSSTRTPKTRVTGGVGELHADSFVLNPGQFVLAETFECIGLPDNIVATIEGKSSIARLGVTLHQTGGWIDAGFRGTITLEMCNVNSRPVKVYAGMPIGQLVFYTTERAENPYFKKGDAKYLDQRQATLSRYHENKK